MSLVFKPKIAYSFEGGRKTVNKGAVKPTKPKQHRRSWLAIELSKPRGKRARAWSPQELNALVDLRALNTSVFDCSKLLKRGVSSTNGVIEHYNLYDAIKSRKLMLVSEVMSDA